MQTSCVTRCVFRDAVDHRFGGRVDAPDEEKAGKTVGATGAGRYEIEGKLRRTCSHGLPNKQ